YFGTTRAAARRVASSITRLPDRPMRARLAVASPETAPHGSRTRASNLTLSPSTRSGNARLIQQSVQPARGPTKLTGYDRFVTTACRARRKGRCDQAGRSAGPAEIRCRAKLCGEPRRTAWHRTRYSSGRLLRPADRVRTQHPVHH